MAQHLVETQVAKAVKALLAVEQRNGQEKEKAGGVRALFDEDPDIFLMFALHRSPTDVRTKPHQIPLVHSLYGEEGMEMCLFTKDPVSEFKAYVENNPVPGLAKIISVTQLRRNYRAYKLKRELLNSFDLFLADDRILPLLPPLLSKAFFRRKKHPYPVVLKGKNWGPNIAKARHSTYYYQSPGPSTSVRVARLSFGVKKSVENVMGSVDAIVGCIPRKWKNIQAIYLKTADSVALPIYSSLPEHTRIPTQAEQPASTLRRKRGPSQLAQEEQDEASTRPLKKKKKASAKTKAKVKKGAKAKAKVKKGAKAKAKANSGKGKAKGKKTQTSNNKKTQKKKGGKKKQSS